MNDKDTKKTDKNEDKGLVEKVEGIDVIYV